METSFFEIHCRQILNRLPSNIAAKLQASFIQFIMKFLEYVDKYFSQNAVFLETIGHFGNGIEELTWNQIQKCIEVIKIQGLNEDNLFNEFTELKLTFEAIKKKEVPLFDQIQFFLSNAAEKETHNSSTTSMQQSEVDEEVEEEQTKLIRSDQLWAINAYVEAIFSEMKRLLNDFRNRMSLDSIAAELQIRRNGSMSCTGMYKYLLSQKELLTAIRSNYEYTFKKQRIE
ncbi:unnamed protein product [Rotaria sp. Silwood1]|nr:unnamed protein product [Rotaria sp. Silwood1]CAF1692574.1 unnamed protein product [Rotaria sp. Silwood1]